MRSHSRFVSAYGFPVSDYNTQRLLNINRTAVHSMYINFICMFAAFILLRCHDLFDSRINLALLHAIHNKFLHSFAAALHPFDKQT